MAWYHKFLGQSAPALTAKSPVHDALSRAVRQAVAAQKDEIRVQVLTEIRGQMNHVFEVVDDLTGQIKGLVKNELQMSEQLRAFEITLKEALQLVQRVNATVLENTAKNARGFSEVNQRITELVGGGNPAQTAQASKARSEPGKGPGMMSAITQAISGSDPAKTASP